MGSKGSKINRVLDHGLTNFFALVKTCDSCQPEQELESSAHLEGSSPPSDSDKNEEKRQKPVCPFEKEGKKGTT